MDVRRTSSPRWATFYRYPSGGLESAREALKTVYEETGGQHWSNSDGWLTDVSLGQWYSVETTDDGWVVALHLEDNNLRGESNDVAFQNYRGKRVINGVRPVTRPMLLP